MCKKLIYLIACALLLSAASGVQAAVLEITPTAPVPDDLDISNFVGALTDTDNVGTEDDSNNPPYWNDWCTYVAHDRGGQGQTFITGDSDVVMTGVWVRHVTYSGADPDQTWYTMQAGAELEIRVTDPAAAGTDAFVLASETYVVTGAEENALPADTTNDQTGTSLWFHVSMDAPVALAANTEYGFDLTSLSGKAGIMFFETDGINDRAEGGNPYEAGTAYTSGVNPDDHGDDLNGANDNNMVVAPGDHVFVVELETPAVVAPVHSYTFEDGTANDGVGEAHGTLVGDAAIVDGAMVTTGQDQWMEMPGDVIAMNTYSEVTVEMWFQSVEGANTGFHMLAYFGDSTDPDPSAGVGNDGFFITSARGDDVSRAAISIGNSSAPWEAESGANGPEYDDGLLHHMVSTIDAMEITLYIDGELMASTPLDAHNSIAGISTNYALLAKGGYGADPEWIGSIEEFNIYNRALSLDEVQANNAAGPQKEGPPAKVDPGTDGLMLHLPLDTASRGTTPDSSANGLNGTVVGDPAFVEGVDILAIELDGVDDYVDCGNPSILDFGTGDFTISAWINMTAIERGTIYAKGGDNSGGVRYTLAMGEANDNKMTLTTDDDSTKVQALGDTVVNDGAWHHVVGVRSGTDLFVYVDGVLDGTNTVPEGYDLSGTSQANALIGAITDARDATGATLEKFFAGAIDDLRIYNRALSAQEVLFLAGM